MSRKRVVGIIPARYDSVRFPGKMLADIHGKPLILCTYENALRCSKLDRVLVATDTPSIYEVIRNSGGFSVMTSSECPTGTDRIAEAVMSAPELMDAEIIVNIQGDEPELDPMTIQKVIEALDEDPQAQVSTACVRILHAEDVRDTSVVKCVKNGQNRALYFSRAMIPHGKTGDFNSEIAYYKHVGIYAFRKDFLLQYAHMPKTPLQIAEDLEQLKILENGYCIHVVEVEKDCIGIDTPNDLEKFLNKRMVS